MSKELLKSLVDFASDECAKGMYLPVVVKGGIGIYPVDVVLFEDALILGNEHIPVSQIESVSLGCYAESNNDELHRVELDTMHDVIDMLTKVRVSPVDKKETHCFNETFEFKDENRVGNVSAIINTTDCKYEIVFPVFSKKI